MIDIRDLRLSAPALTVLVALAYAPGASAQSIPWRQDYAAARKEAVEKGLPILIDFYTENCMWCKRLDATTFRDTAVAGLLTDQYVALKVDAEKEPLLTQALKVTQFPSMVVAAPDGKILGVLEGYQEAAPFAENLKRAAALFVPPEWMMREFQEASRAYASGDYSRAVTLLKSVTQDGKDRPVQVRARGVLADLEQQGMNRLARAKLMQDRGQSTEAAEALADLLKSYAGTQAAADGSTLLASLAAKPELQTQQREARARELLAQARDDFRTKQYLGCLERCELIAENYVESKVANEAAQLAAQIKGDPEMMNKAIDHLNLKSGAMYLALAETWMQKGQPQQAQVCLERVQQLAPGTRQAELASVKLAKIQGGPNATQQTEYKKPK